MSANESPQGSLPSELIVWESRGRWALGLARLVPEWRSALRETRGTAECVAALAAAGASWVVIELTRPRVEAGLELLATCTTRFPAATVSVVLEHGLDVDEWALRELGAVHVVNTRQGLVELSGMIRRGLAGRRTSPRTELERALAELPWSS